MVVGVWGGGGLGVVESRGGGVKGWWSGWWGSRMVGSRGGEGLGV